MNKYKLVPVEPTPEMIEAGAKQVDWYSNNARDAYAAMLDAAPEPEAEPVYWQWRRKGQPWSLENTFNSEVQVTTKDSERRALYTAPQPAAPEVQAEPQSLPDAMATVIAAMQTDPDYAWSWHCNVAMAFVDAGGDHYTANQGAALFMKLLANVEPAHALPEAPQPAKPAEQEPFTVLVRKHSWLPGQWEAAPCGFPDYGKQWADERINVYTAPQPAAPEVQAKPVAYLHCPSVAMDAKVRPVLSFEKYEGDYASGIYAERIPLYAAPPPAKQAEQEPFTVLVRKHSWLPNQWEAAPCGFPDYGTQWADERINVYTAPQPAKQPLSQYAIDRIVGSLQVQWPDYFDLEAATKFARAIEAAHGITGETK